MLRVAINIVGHHEVGLDLPAPLRMAKACGGVPVIAAETRPSASPSKVSNGLCTNSAGSLLEPSD